MTLMFSQSHLSLCSPLQVRSCPISVHTSGTTSSLPVLWSGLLVSQLCYSTDQSLLTGLPTSSPFPPKISYRVWPGWTFLKQRISSCHSLAQKFAVLAPYPCEGPRQRSLVLGSILLPFLAFQPPLPWIPTAHCAFLLLSLCLECPPCITTW